MGKKSKKKTLMTIAFKGQHCNYSASEIGQLIKNPDDLSLDLLEEVKEIIRNIENRFIDGFIASLVANLTHGLPTPLIRVKSKREGYKLLAAQIEAPGSSITRDLTRYVKLMTLMKEND